MAVASSSVRKAGKAAKQAAAKDAGMWLGVEELLQPPQPAVRGKRARVGITSGEAAQRPGAGGTAMPAGTEGRPASGTPEGSSPAGTARPAGGPASGTPEGSSPAGTARPAGGSASEAETRDAGAGPTPPPPAAAGEDVGTAPGTTARSGLGDLEAAAGPARSAKENGTSPGGAPASQLRRSRIAGRAEVKKAFISPSLALSPGNAAPAAPATPQSQLVIRRPHRPKISPASAAAELPGEPQGPRDPRHGPGPRIQVGPFWSMMPIPDKHLQLLRDLQSQFQDEAVLRALAEMLSEAEIPIKYYEWFVSHYARDHRTTQEIDVGDGSTAMLDVHDSYRSSRWAVRKRHWDFFGKRVKVAFEADGATHLVSVSQLNAFLFARRFGLRELIVDVFDELERHYEQGKVESEMAAIRAAREAAREAGLPEDAPLKRKRGRRRKPKDAPPPVEPVMLSEGTVTTRLSLQD